MNDKDTYRGLVEKMGALYREMQSMIDAANENGGDMSAEDTQRFDAMQAEYRKLQEQRERNVSLMQLAQKDTNLGWVESPDAPERRSATKAVKANKGTRWGSWADTDEYRDAFDSYLRRGELIGPNEQRALSEGGTGLGDVIAPTEFSDKIFEQLQKVVTLRKLAQIMPMGSWKRDLVIESNVASVNWTTEGSSITDSLSTNPTFSSVVLNAKKLAGLAKVSRELAEDAPARGPGFSLENILTNSFAKGFAEKEEQGFLVGTGASGQPTGILTVGPSATTASTGPSVGKQLAANTAITAAEIQDLVYSLPRQYRQHPSCAILVSDKVLQFIRQAPILSSSTTTYFWQPSGVLGEPDRVMGIPIYASHYVPDPATTSTGYTGGGICGLIGAFDFLVIGQRSQFSLRVLNERFADEDNIGMVCTSRVDIKYTQTDAFRFLRGKN
jgi:HK97 family phage major capsid protein